MKAKKLPRGTCPKCGKDCAVNATGEVYPHRGPDGSYHSLLKAVRITMP